MCPTTKEKKGHQKVWLSTPRKNRQKDACYGKERGELDGKRPTPRVVNSAGNKKRRDRKKFLSFKFAWV